jgi:hypothetical protein
MDKTKLEYDLETAETRKKFKITNILLLLLCVAVIIAILLMMNIRSTLSKHEERITALEKQTTVLQDDIKKLTADNKGTHQ